MTKAEVVPAARWPIKATRWWARISDYQVLNGDTAPEVPVHNLAEVMRVTLANLVSAHADGIGLVDYLTMARSEAYSEYRVLAAQLRTFHPGSLQTDGERKAFWINLYNALILDAVVAMRLSGAPADGWFERAAYNVGGYRFSANDIEHGVLRANRWHLLAAGPQFGRGDPRRAWSVSALDPRVHFALNCAARSCPPIRAYSAERLDEQLHLAAFSFLNGGQLTLDRDTMRLGLSRMFQYYGHDFGAGPFALWGHARLVQFAAPFAADTEDRAFLTEHAKQLRVEFLPYDWSLNAYDPG